MLLLEETLRLNVERLILSWQKVAVLPVQRIARPLSARSSM